MITSSPSPTLHSTRSSPQHNASASLYVRAYPRSGSSSPAAAFSKSYPSAASQTNSPAARLRLSPTITRTAVDAATQYSPPSSSASSITGGKRKDRASSPESVPAEPKIKPLVPGQKTGTTSTSSSSPLPSTATSQTSPVPSASGESSTSKRSRLPNPAKKMMPARYEDCDVKDLVQLIAAMLMELIRFNDSIPLQDGRLTRFHSRAPPGISVTDYLQRLTTHATLSPPILLSMVYYIDRLCVLYPAFTISSLTVHRFLIASATVASKGLSDAFWTNNTYARVGGVSLKELALLELEFLWRVEWRIVPKPEVLVDYYRSLIERSDGFELQQTPAAEAEAEDPG